MQILIVDDSMTIRQAISKTVEKMGFDPVMASNGAEALARLRISHDRTQLIILDWNMPVMDGITVLQKIKASEDYRNIPVLMATSDGIQEDVIAAIRAGAVSYLVKPFNQEELIDRINHILHRQPEKEQPDK